MVGASYSWDSDFGKAKTILGCGMLWCFNALDDDTDAAAGIFALNYPA